MKSCGHVKGFTSVVSLFSLKVNGREPISCHGPKGTQPISRVSNSTGALTTKTRLIESHFGISAARFVQPRDAGRILIQNSSAVNVGTVYVYMRNRVCNRLSGDPQPTAVTDAIIAVMRARQRKGSASTASIRNGRRRGTQAGNRIQFED
jgi:hypothetical protein